MSEIENNQYLTGLIIGIRSTYGNDLYLKNIKFLNEGIFVGNNISQIINEPESNNFKEVLGYEHINQKKGDGCINYLIGEKINYYIIPVYYEDMIMVNNFPIEFTIQKNNELIKFYFSNYKYYEQLNIIINDSELIIYDIL